MQRTYFLGGASPQGFETAFWTEQRTAYGFYLKGGPGTGKSTLMKQVAAAFADEDISVYHCASDPRSLDAVVLENRGIFIADSTAPHEASTPLPYVTGETVDLAAYLHADILRNHAADIHALYAENQNAHKQAKKGLAGIAEMETIICETGAAALDTEKLKKYAARLAKRLLPKHTDAAGKMLRRQSCAVTPLGKMHFLPEGFDLILVHDPFYAAGAVLLQELAEAASAAGQICEITHALTTHQPIMLILPAQKLVLAAVTEAVQPELPKPVSIIKMQRFYDAEILRQQRSLLRFCTKTAAATEEQVIALLAEALRVHDELEKYYIAALDTPALSRITAELITKLKAR